MLTATITISIDAIASIPRGRIEQHESQGLDLAPIRDWHAVATGIVLPYAVVADEHMG